MQTPTLARKTKGRKAPLESRKRPLTGQAPKAETVKVASVRKTRAPLESLRPLTGQARKSEKVAAPVVAVQKALVIETVEPRYELAKAIENRRLKEEAEARARALFARARKVFYAEEGFLGVEPEAILQLDTHVHHAIEGAEHGWMFEKMVHSVQVGPSFDGGVRYELEQVDPRRSTGVAFSVVLDVSPATLGGLVEEAGEGMERYYSPDVLLEYRIVSAMDRMAREGVRFAGDEDAWRTLNAHDELEYFRKLRAALGQFDMDDRELIADLVVTPPTEGTRLFGFRIGRRAARIQNGAFFAPVDVTEESILATLGGEIEKKRQKRS